MGNQYSQPIDPNDPVDLRSFQLGRVIGKGAFGKVRIVERQSDKKSYALKYMKKEQIIKQRAHRNIIRERQLLECVFHPFIVNLCYAFQDDEYVYMISDLMLGGDLRFHLDRYNTLEENVVTFYAAEVASALIYLHSRNVLHRDIKPDNLLLNLDGHVHITDFNCACILEDGKAIISETGTQGYMAPEVYTDFGYRESVDWWSLGITLYELLHGERPFSGPTVDDLAHSVKNDPIQWKRSCSPELLNFVLSLLDRNTGRRLGCGPRGPLDIKKHVLMERHNIDWEKLEDKKIVPPFIPNPTEPNFDLRYELEELMLEDDPLEGGPKRRNSLNGIDPDHPMARELQMIQDEFKHFDFNLWERYTGIVDPTKLSVGEPPSWVRCVDPPVRLPPSTAPCSPCLVTGDIPTSTNGDVKSNQTIGNNLKKSNSTATLRTNNIIDTNESNGSKSIFLSKPFSPISALLQGNSTPTILGSSDTTSNSSPSRPSLVQLQSPSIPSRTIAKLLPFIAGFNHSSTNNNADGNPSLNNSPISISLNVSPSTINFTNRTNSPIFRTHSPDIPPIPAPKRALHRPELRHSPPSTEFIPINLSPIKSHPSPVVMASHQPNSPQTFPSLSSTLHDCTSPVMVTTTHTSSASSSYNLTK